MLCSIFLLCVWLLNVFVWLCVSCVWLVYALGMTFECVCMIVYDCVRLFYDLCMMFVLSVYDFGNGVWLCLCGCVICVYDLFVICVWFCIWVLFVVCDFRLIVECVWMIVYEFVCLYVFCMRCVWVVYDLWMCSYDLCVWFVSDF